MKRIKWSQSLDKNARICQRKAFYTGVFACPQAKDGTLRREVFLLKSAIDVSLWRGNIVHLVIQERILPSLKRKLPPDFAAAQIWALELIDKQAGFSQRGRYRRQSKASAGHDFCVLKSDFNGGDSTEDEINQVKDGVIIALNNLETHFSDVLSRASNALKIEIEKELHFSLDERIQVDAKIDFLFFEHNNHTVIVDWKAGEGFSGNAREQLQAYAYAVSKCGYWHNITADNIELIEANLMTGERTVYPITEDDLADVDDRIFTGSQLLQPIFEHPANQLKPEDFAPADSAGACEWCLVREICNGNLLSRVSASTQPALPFELV